MRYTSRTETRRYRAGALLNRREVFRNRLVRELLEFTERRGPLSSTFTVTAPPAWHQVLAHLARRIK